MIRKYITITIVPTSSKKVKRFQVSLFNVFLLFLILSGVILHAGWVFRTFLIEETTYGAQSIKTKFEKQKVFLSQYNKDVANLNQSIEELNDYHYKLGKILLSQKYRISKGICYSHQGSSKREKEYFCSDCYSRK